VYQAFSSPNFRRPGYEASEYGGRHLVEGIPEEVGYVPFKINV